METQFTNTASRYTGVRVLVLGASGFIGRHVSQSLAEAGAEVFVAVRNCRSWSNLSEGPESVEVKEVDLLDNVAISNLITDVYPTVVFNLAGYGVDRSERAGPIFWRMNALLPLTVGEALVKQSIADWDGQRLVHVGSALEYGRCSGRLNEDTEPRPTTVYGRTKLAGTWALQDVSRAAGLKGVVARLFTIYGPGEHSGRLLPSLVEAARTGAGLGLTDGLQKRDFTYVEDVVEGLLRIALSDAPPGEIINLATGRLTSVRRFAETAAEALGIQPSRLHFGALAQRDEEMAHDPVSTARLQSYTHWKPSINIREGIRRALKSEAGRAYTK